jgi:membrane associated rhomboid family serine protease
MIYGEPFSYRTKPPAVKALLAVHAAVYLGQWIFWDPVVRTLGLSPGRVLGSLWLWQPLSYVFLHTIGLFGFLFFLIHMYILSTLGRDLEHRWGPAGFSLYYLGCGLGGAAAILLLAPFAPHTSLGSSAALLGLITAFAVHHAGAQVMFFFIPMTAKQLVLLIAGLEVLLAVARMTPWVEAASHLSAMGTGFLLIRSRFLDRNWAKSWRQWKYRRQAEQQHLRVVNIEHEVDRILDKVLKKGAGSLTREEQELMQQYSKMKK